MFGPWKSLLSNTPQTQHGIVSARIIDLNQRPRRRKCKSGSEEKSGLNPNLKTADQSEVIAFLSQGESYGAPASLVERIETHISMVFLVGDRAIKLKRAIRFSYLDFS